VLAHSSVLHKLSFLSILIRGELKMDDIKILGIVGSLRKDSYNRYALMAAQELLPEGAELDLIDINGIPVYDQDNEMTLPASVIEFKRRILAADAILFATPEYNYSVPGGLKNAIDWASRPYGKSAWTGKPAAVMGASVGNLGTARAQYHLRQILVTLNMPVVNQPEVMIANAATRFDLRARLTDVMTRQQIQNLLSSLLQLVRINKTNQKQNSQK
jgi:chromate reductase